MEAVLPRSSYCGVPPVSLESNALTPHGRERVVLWLRATPTGAPEHETLAVRKRVAAALAAAGGELFAHVGAGVGASFDPLELTSVIELALRLLQQAKAPAMELDAGAALALGELVPDHAGLGPVGSAIDRALTLAAAADRFELVLDEATHARVESSHLFARVFVCGPTLAGHVLDARHVTRESCRAALAFLSPAPLPPGLRASYERLAALAADRDVRRIVLAGAHPHVALDALQRLRGMLEPALCLHLGSQAAGLQPLGGLQLALWRARAELGPTLDTTLLGVVSGFSEGAALARDEASVALRELLRKVRATGRRAWLVLDRAREIDRASLAAVSEAMAEQSDDCLLFLLLDERDAAPRNLPGGGDHELVAIEPLTRDDRVYVAAGLLGTAPGSELARRVAQLGGDSVLGIVEATRTLVCAGDLVREGDAFLFRTRPRNASQPIPVDALLTERASGLEPAAQRVLEALCVAPCAVRHDFVARVGALDGLNEAQLAAGFAQLERENWIGRSGGLGPLEQAIRNAVRNGMPPARAAELHRFVAEVLRQEPVLQAGPSFGHALLAQHLAEGGRESEAAGALLDAAQAATESGFARMAVRLAALALKLDASPGTRERARNVAGTIETQPPPPQGTFTPETRDSEPSASAKLAALPDPRQMAHAAIEAAISAIMRGELDAAEGLIDTAMAAGFSRAAAQRLLAVAQLFRGDIPEAVRALKQAQVAQGGGGARSREKIAAAMILVEAGERLEAVRSALDALAGARREHDARGERVALHVLSLCYRALDRPSDADRIASAADALA